ncbi:MAG: hypothetical protein FAF03_12560 [Epsilonproteobacteria bacterium]|nr:hypothetical protein [Campylobacterota bacterium]
MKTKKRDFFSKNIDIIKKELLEKKFHTQNDLHDLLRTFRENSLISKGISSTQFFNLLQTRLNLITHSASSENMNKIRYTLYQDVNIYDFVQTFGKDGFFSMTTALNLQGLSDSKSQLVFFSKELSVKNAPQTKSLTQEAIDQAYQKEYRLSRNIVTYKEKHIVYLTPKHTDRIEVIQHGDYQVSSIHRVLVEMILNIQYFNGFQTLIEIFEPLQERLDVQRIFDVVSAFNLIYPYFQLLGFMLERLGFSRESLKIFKDEVGELKFYTEKNKNTYQFDAYWRVYFN